MRCWLSNGHVVLVDADWRTLHKAIRDGLLLVGKAPDVRPADAPELTVSARHIVAFRRDTE